MAADAQPWPARYELLDGLRGLACLSVLLHHIGLIAFGHYAVMVFFVISGYCITASVRASERNRTPFLEFMLRRVRRIYPPYLFALLFFAATRIVKTALFDSGSWHPSILDWVQNLTLTQWLSLPLRPIAWPGDNRTLFVAAFWSLNYEEQFYLVMGLALLLSLKFQLKLTRAVIALFAMGLMWNFTQPGGWITGFFLEYWAHFALGAAVYFILCEYSGVRARSAFYVGASLLATYCVGRLLFASNPTELTHRAYIELALLSVFAMSLVLLRPYSAAIGPRIAWQPIAALGTISYSLYLVHQFNLTFVNSLVSRLLPLEMPAMLTMAKILVHIGIGAAFWYVCERPFVRKRAAAVIADSLPPREEAPASART